MRTDAPAFTARAIAAYRSSSSSTRSVLVAPKAANEALVKGLAREEGRCNVRANSILVGVIEAGMFPVLLEQGQCDQAWIDETQKMLALKRWGRRTHGYANRSNASKNAMNIPTEDPAEGR